MNTTPCLPARTDDLPSGLEAALAASWPAEGTAAADLDDDWAAFVAGALELAQRGPGLAGGLVALSH
jgi:hypothetical protein